MMVTRGSDVEVFGAKVLDVVCQFYYYFNNIV